jgi:hypothetical protein
VSTTTNDMPETAAAAVAEATRIASEAARNGTETAKASIEAASSYFDDTNKIGRELLGTWSSQTEAAIKAAFAAQNAAIDAGLGLFDLGVKGNRQAVAQFSEIVKRTQKATIETWDSYAKMATKVTEPTRR